MGIFIGFCIVVALIYFIFSDKGNTTNYASSSSSYHQDTNNRYNNVYDVWVYDELSPECQQILYDVYNYNGSVTVFSFHELFHGGDELYESYVRLNQNWTEEQDDYIESVQRRALVMKNLLDGSGKMAVWCDKDRRWDCDRRVFYYRKDGKEY